MNIVKVNEGGVAFQGHCAWWELTGWKCFSYTNVLQHPLARFVRHVANWLAFCILHIHGETPGAKQPDL